MEGKNAGAQSAFGAEVYNPVNYETLTGATSTGTTGANVIFTTLEYVGQNWDLGTTVGYSCSSGYALNTCDPTYTCTQIFNTGITSTTANCTNDCAVVCSDTFP